MLPSFWDPTACGGQNGGHAGRRKAPARPARRKCAGGPRDERLAHAHAHVAVPGRQPPPSCTDVSGHRSGRNSDTIADENWPSVMHRGQRPGSPPLVSRNLLIVHAL